MIKRNEYLDILWSWKELEVIKVVTGIRRCGKSTLLMQFQERLKEAGVEEKQIISVNFEETENEPLLDRAKLYDYLKSKLCGGKFTYIFLDEIQKVKDYETVVDSLYVKPNVDIYITGSNSYLLSGELATYLSGRYIEINMYPLSFKEYYDFMGNGDKREFFANYMTDGGMPYAALIKKSGLGSETLYLESIYNTVFVKDIEERKARTETDGKKRNPVDIPLLKRISQYLSSVIGSPVSSKAIADYLTSSGRKTSHNTVSDYIEALTDAYLYYKIERMDVSGKQLLKQTPKYYMVDLGFRKTILSKRNYDIGFSIENIVYFELRRRGYNVNTGRLGAAEVDFVARKGDETEYYQITASMLGETTFEREMKPLKAIKDNYAKYVLTLDDYSAGNYEGIRIMNVIDWLLA